MKKRRKKTALKKCDDEWKRQVKERAEWKCEHCGRSKLAKFRLDTHHLIHRNRHFFRHNLNNGMCLCKMCHTLSSDFSAHSTPWAFDKWLEEAKPEQFAWFVKNRQKTFPGLKINYEEVYKMLAQNNPSTSRREHD